MRMDTVRSNQEISLLNSTVRKCRDNSGAFRLLDVDASGVVMQFNASFAKSVKEGLSHDTARDAKGFVSVLLLATIEDSPNVTQVS